jgi:hypothetical protein
MAPQDGRRSRSDMYSRGTYSVLPSVTNYYSTVCLWWQVNDPGIDQDPTTVAQLSGNVNRGEGGQVRVLVLLEPVKAN